METQLIPVKEFKEYLEELCQSRVVEAVKGIEALGYIDSDRGLFCYERSRLISLKDQLKTNEEWLRAINPEYLGVQ